MLLERAKGSGATALRRASRGRIFRSPGYFMQIRQIILTTETWRTLIPFPRTIPLFIEFT